MVFQKENLGHFVLIWFNSGLAKRKVIYYGDGLLMMANLILEKQNYRIHNTKVSSNSPHFNLFYQTTKGKNRKPQYRCFSKETFMQI